MRTTETATSITLAFGEVLYQLVGQGKKLFCWRLPEGNPYLRMETRNTYTSRFTEVAMAFASI
ncbi:TPA: reverse transcriptase [Citrobacter amalonaticus]|nr:reverse transcriptase [Citrobacter amalonaticus]